jgi:hypothetical protein
MKCFSARTLLVLTIICTMTIDASGQTNKRSIRGTVLDASTGLQLTHVSVQLVDAMSGTVQGGMSNDNGSFQLNALSGEYFSLALTAIGYKDTVLHVAFKNKSTLDLGQIKMLSLVKPLRPVHVYGDRPLIEQNIDKLTYNVDADPDNTYLNAFEILRKVPFVTTDANDNVLLNGNSDFKIFINGKPSLMFSRSPSSVLQSLQASSIKSIEVITMPSARYQAEGAGGIININTFRSITGGINGGVNFRALELDGIQAAADLTAGGRKMSISVNSGYIDKNLPESQVAITRENIIQKQTLNQFSTDSRKGRALNNGAELTFQPSDRNVFTASFVRNSADNKMFRNQHSLLFDQNAGSISVFQAFNNTTNTITTTDYALDFEHTFKNNDERKFQMSYKRSESDGWNDFVFIREPSSSVINNNGKNNYTDKQDDQYIEMNYIQPLKQHLLQMGVSDIRRTNTSESMFFHFDSSEGVYVKTTEEDNNFSFSEEVKAAYLSLILKMNRWSLETGGRWENANTNFDLYSGGTAVSRYDNIIPNITLSHKFKRNGLMRTGYAQRIARPGISFLDPYVNNIDAFNITYGNPELAPTVTHVINVAYNMAIKKFFFNINAFHQFTNNSIQQITRIGADTISRTTYENIGTYSSSTASLSINSVLFKRINLNFNGSASHVKFATSTKQSNSKRSGMTYSAVTSFSVNLKKWALAGNVNYLSSLLTFQGSSTTFLTNSISVSKHFFAKNNFTAALSASEPFLRRRTTTTEFNDPDFHMVQQSTLVNRRINLSFNYRFVKIKTEQ